MIFTYKLIQQSAAAICLLVTLAACQKMTRPGFGNYPKDTNPPGGPLKFYTAFDGGEVDSIRANFGTATNITYENGISGQAYKGSPNGYIKYPSANDFSQVTSFTVAFWMKKRPHTDGAEFVFALPSSNYWHNSELFMLIENIGQSSGDSMATKLVIQDQWVEFVGNQRLPRVLDGNWHHLAFVYDEATSKLTTYLDGAARTGLPANLTDIKKAGSPRGKLTFSGVSQFIIGASAKHAGVGGAPDAWMVPYTGSLDQFRLYGTALSAAEVSNLYTRKM
jgi:hypothetical protein